MAATPAGIERAYGVSYIRAHIPITLDLAEIHNFNVWRQLFLTHCQRFGFHGHIDGTLVSSGDFDVSWKNRDEIVKLWLYGTLSPSLYHSTFQTESTSRDIWLRIENQFRYVLTSPEQYQQYWPRPSHSWQPHQPYPSFWNGPQFSNSYNNWQNPGSVYMYEPPSPDYLAFNAINLQQPMDALRYPTASPGQTEAFTHFVSISLDYLDLKNNLAAFKNSILGNNGENPSPSILAGMGIEESIFASPNTFHLTVVMLKLGKRGSLVKAREILESISSDVRQALKNRPVFIKLNGLRRMGTKPLDETSVLYAPVEEVDDEGRLLNACHVIIDAFESAGFTGKDAKIHLKLHATVMNAIYRKDKSKKTFNARGILEEFGNEDWGTYLIEEAHISQRYPYDPEVYFPRCGSLRFPTSDIENDQISSTGVMAGC